MDSALVVGLGVAGEAAARQLARRGWSVVVAEDRPGPATRRRAGVLEAAGVEVVEAPGPGALDALVDHADLLVPSPGVPRRHRATTRALRRGIPVWTEFELAARWSSLPLVAVTGTNGKTTVTTLVAGILEATGVRTALAGNNDLPLVDALDLEGLDVVVVEASSFRLEFTETFAPRVGAWLNLAPDHLDWHGDLASYTATKARLWANAGPDDVAVANAEDPVVLDAARASRGRVVTFGLGAGDWHVAGDELVGPDGPLLAVGGLARDLPHDRANALAAAATATAAGAAPEAVGSVLRSFRGLPHRITPVGEHGGVRWLDDSKATDPHAAVAAVRGFASVVLVAGGRNKGLDLSVLAGEADRLRAVVAIGESAPEVAAAFAGSGVPVTTAGSMDEAVARARAAARAGDVVLLSPGCASFDWYSGYGERGDDFARAVAEELARCVSPVAARRAPAGTGKGRGGRRPTASAGRTTFVLLGAVVTILLVTGVVMVLSASSVQSLKELGSSWNLFIRHLTWLTIGAVALVVTVSIDYRRWRTLALPLLAASAGLLLLVLVPGFGLRVNGARSWIGVGSLTLQPSEVAKLALILFVAELLSRRSANMADSRLTLRPVLVVAGAIALLVMLQPDLGTTMVLGALVLALLYVGGVPLLKLGTTAAVGGGLAMFLALRKEYRRERLLAFLDPSADPERIGYQITQSLTGVASGRLTGVGLGASRAKWGFLPNAHTDFIFAIIGEETGLIGALVVVALFVAFAVLGVRAALHAPDRFGTLVAAGITAWVVSQALVNIGGVVGLLPITGLTLPFVSFGGTSLVVTMAATGILLNIARAGVAKAPIDLR